MFVVRSVDFVFLIEDSSAGVDQTALGIVTVADRVGPGLSVVSSGNSDPPNSGNSEPPPPSDSQKR
jgi:hypothetical protein